MRLRQALLCCLLLPLLWQGSARAAAAPQAWAYLGWWMPDAWRGAPLERLDRLLFFQLKAGPDGAIGERHGWPEQWGALREAARGHGVALDLTITILDTATFEQLFNSASARARLLEQATELARHADVAGLQLDMEVYSALAPDTMRQFQALVRELARRLRSMAPARKLSVFIPMGAASQYYDRATLAQVDYVVMQGYDAHWITSQRAGPLAPLAGTEPVTWEKALAAGRALGVPRSRLLFGFPLFGYDWPVRDAAWRSATTGPAQQLSYAPLPAGLVPAMAGDARARALRHGVHHDQRSGSAAYRYQGDDGNHRQGWFEDSWSLERKAAWVKRHQVGGMAFFMLGYDQSELVRHYLRRPARKKAAR